MKTLFLVIIIASISVATITSISFFFNVGNEQHCTYCPALSTPGQPLQLRDVITEPQTVLLGDTFLIYVNVYNPNPYSVYVNMGCMSSPLSATFDKNVETKREVISCPGPSKQEISPNQEARIVGPGPDTIYNASSTGQTNAKITLLYEWNGGSGAVTTSKNFTIETPAPYPSEPSYGQLKLGHSANIPESKSVSSTGKKLWTYRINVTNANFTLNYDITNGYVLGIKKDMNSNSLIVSINAMGDGQLTIELPRALIDAKIGNTDDQFFVLGDGQEILYKEIHKAIEDRVLSIPFQQGIGKIEIIGVNPI